MLVLLFFGGCKATDLPQKMKRYASVTGFKKEKTEEYKQLHALGYCPESDVIVDACVFLLSDKARFITGVNLPVSGGAELGYRRNV